MPVMCLGKLGLSNNQRVHFKPGDTSVIGKFEVNPDFGFEYLIAKSNIVEESIFGDKIINVLRVIPVGTLEFGNWAILNWPTPIYSNARSGIYDHISFTISNRLNEKVHFTSGSVIAVFHFRQK